MMCRSDCDDSRRVEDERATLYIWVALVASRVIVIILLADTSTQQAKHMEIKASPRKRFHVIFQKYFES